MPDKATDFGFQEIPFSEKTKRVARVFHSVADKYDVMNDLMSFGIHRIWKRLAMQYAAPRAKEIFLDVAGGTGDLSQLLAKAVGDEGLVLLTDINQSMLAHGREKCENNGAITQVRYALANAEQLPFANNTFSGITIAFGLRNITDKALALREMARVLQPGGRLVILEFSKPIIPCLEKAYDRYSFDLLPWLGNLVAKDAESYRYLAESIRRHPDQEKLKTLILENHFDACAFFNVTGGIVAIHRAYKY